MRKAFNCITAALFFVITAIFGIGVLVFSEEKFRPSSPEEFPKRAEGYIERNFPLKANWRSMYSSIITAAGQEQIGDVYISDSSLIEVISKADENKLSSMIGRINDFAAAHKDSNIFAMIVPTASGIYSAGLPNVITAIDQQKLIDDIYFRLDSSIHTLDAFNPLFSARDDYVYFRTDDRWTEYGAYTVYNKIIRKLGFAPLHLSSYDMEYADRNYYGNLYQKTYYNGVPADFINIFRNKNGSFVTGVSAWSGGQEFTSLSIYYTPALSSENKLDVFLGGNDYEKYTIRTSNTDAPRLLLIKGRYANMFVPFLTPHYSEITLVDPARLGTRSIDETVDADAYDQILILYDIGQMV